MKLTPKKQNSRKKPAIIIASIITLLAMGGGAYAYYSQTSSDTNTTNDQKVNLQKTATEKAATQALKDDPTKKVQNTQNDVPPAPSQNSSGKQIANVLLNFATINNGTVNVAGMVTNVVEDSGTCTYLFTNGANVLSKTTTALVNPTSTTCKAVAFPSSELVASGTWSVKLSYSSSASEGTSDVKEFTKP